jgi:hypothetical protein
VAAKKYKLLNGLNYRPDGVSEDEPETRAEPGDVVSDLPAKSIGWLQAQGHIEPVATRARAPRKAKARTRKGK